MKTMVYQMKAFKCFVGLVIKLTLFVIYTLIMAIGLSTFWFGGWGYGTLILIIGLAILITYLKYVNGWFDETE